MRFLLLAALLAASPATAQTGASDAFKTALRAADRPADAWVQDGTRQVERILAAAQVEPGDRALDVGSGSGYLALLLSTLAGEAGHVDVHNTPGWLAQFPYLDPEALKRRIRRGNIGFIVSDWDAIPGEPASYDVIVMGQVYHDAVHERADIPRMNARLFELLKPGGRLVIEDHDADPAMPVGWQAGLHRIARDAVVEVLTAEGFALTGDVQIQSGHDDRRFNVFRPGIRGRTDRYILTFTKPAA